MKSHATKFLFVVSLIMLATSATLWLQARQMRKEAKTSLAEISSPTHGNHFSTPTSREAPSSPPDQNSPSSRQHSAATASTSKNTALLESILQRWKDAALTLEGDALVAMQRDLTREAITLGASPELTRFLEFLKNEGAHDLWKLCLEEAGPSIFSDPSNTVAHDWLQTIEDNETRRNLAKVAGQLYQGDDLKTLVSSLKSDVESQAALITGYTVNLAKTNPDLAVKMFNDLRPSNMNYYGYLEVMKVLPVFSDFPKISSTLPDDSKDLARMARGELLKSWANTNPKDAAQYILSNTTTVRSSQLDNVLGPWMQNSPDEAAAWINSLAPGDLQDRGSVYLSKHWSERDPVTAWNYVSKIGDFDQRVEAATRVFKQWEKVDNQAANQAWLSLFSSE